MAKANSKKLSTVLFSPHIHSEFSLSMVMWNVTLALLPAGFASVYYFGYNSLRIIVLSVLTAVISEFLMNKATKGKVTVLDGSAVVTGLLFAYNMPPLAPWYVVVFGSAFAMMVVKWSFGGLGYNFMNPALGGRIFVVAAWPGIMINHWSPTIRQFMDLGDSMTTASATIISPDSITSATPLSVLKMEGWSGVADIGYNQYWDLFWGNIPGCIGETSAFALLIGFLFLAVRRIVTLEVPVVYVGTVAVLTWIFGGLPFGLGFFAGDPLYHVLSGGLILGACFMATDYVTSPLTFKGSIVFALMLGVLTVIIRLLGGYPEGVSYAIVLMNIFVPLIDKYTKNRVYGYSKNRLGF